MEWPEPDPLTEPLDAQPYLRSDPFVEFVRSGYILALAALRPIICSV
jgi:hypothetical protein